MQERDSGTVMGRVRVVRPVTESQLSKIPDLLELVRRAVEGGPEGQSQLLRELYAPVRRYLRRWLGARPEAEALADDLTQETLLQVARSIGTCDAVTEGGVFSWVLTVARNCAAAHLRRRREELARRSYPKDLDGASQGASYQEWACGHAEHSPTFSALLRVLMAAGAALPPEAEALVWRRVMEGASWNEIASGLGTTYRAAQRRYQRVQVALRREVLCRVSDLPEPERSAVLAHLKNFAERGT